LAILGAFTLLFIMHLGYSLTIDKRTAKLEKKNGKETKLLEAQLAEIEKLKKEMARLAKLTLKRRGDKN
jgi:hypothetical protein